MTFAINTVNCHKSANCASCMFSVEFMNFSCNRGFSITCSDLSISQIQFCNLHFLFQMTPGTRSYSTGKTSWIILYNNLIERKTSIQKLQNIKWDLIRRMWSSWYVRTVLPAFVRNVFYSRCLVFIWLPLIYSIYTGWFTMFYRYYRIVFLGSFGTENVNYKIGSDW